MKQRTMIFAGLTVLLLIFFFTIGFPLILRGSSALSQVFTGQKDDSDSRNPLLQTVEVDDLPEFTNKDTVTVSGHAANFRSIEIYVNGLKAKGSNLDDLEEFSEEIKLRKGENDIYVKALAKNQEKQSETFKVTYQADKPSLEISEPSDGSTVKNNEIKIAGKTGENIEISVNGSPVVVGTDGNFQTTVRLNEGENKIKVVAEDEAGNTEEKELTIKYEK